MNDPDTTNTPTTLATPTPTPTTTTPKDGKPKLLSLNKTLDIIAGMYEKKRKADQIDDAANKDRDTLAEFAVDFFVQTYGMLMKKKKMDEFKQSVVHYREAHLRIKWFGTMIGWNEIDYNNFGDMLYIPFQVNSIDAFLQVLSELIPVDAIEERLDDDPCLVEVPVVLKALGTDGEGLFDGSYRHTAPFHEMLEKLKQRATTIKGVLSIELDLCMGTVMKAWYLWKVPQIRPKEIIDDSDTRPINTEHDILHANYCGRPGCVFGNKYCYTRKNCKLHMGCNLCPVDVVCERCVKCAPIDLKFRTTKSAALPVAVVAAAQRDEVEERHQQQMERQQQEERHELHSAHLYHQKLLLTPHPPTTQNLHSQTGASSVQNRNTRVFNAATLHNEEIDDEYVSLNRLHAEGRAGRRRSGKGRSSHLPKVARYLRESQPKSKYVTDPAALSHGQDLQSAAFLIKELDQGRVERLRRFQPKAKNRKRRRKKNKKKKQKQKQKQKKATTTTNIPEWLTGIYLGKVDSSTVAAAASSSIAIHDHAVDPDSVWNRLKESPHAHHVQEMTFINQPNSHCKEKAAEMSLQFHNELSTSLKLQTNDNPAVRKHMTRMVHEMLTMLDNHDRSQNYSQTSNSIWSSLPSTLENQLIQPTITAYKAELDEDFETHRSTSSKSKRIAATTQEKLMELKALKGKSFEEQVEGVVHGILAWFFNQYGSTSHLGSATVRSGRASVVKRYEELCKQTPHAIDSIVSITSHHGKEDREVGASKKHATENSVGTVNGEASAPALGQKINYVEQNKLTKSLVIRDPLVYQETLQTKKEKRKSVALMVRQRRQSIMIEKIESIEDRKIERLERINAEMEQAIKERRTRMWASMFKTISFWNKTTSQFLKSREKALATVKLQSMFRKSLFKKKGPAQLKILAMAKRVLIPKLKRARTRINVRSADQLIEFLHDLGQLGSVSFAIRRFKKQNRLTQKLFRTYKIVTNERLACLVVMFKRVEKQRYLNKMELARQQKNIKNGRHSTSALTTPLGSDTKGTNEATGTTETSNNAKAINKEALLSNHHSRKIQARKYVHTDPRLVKRIEKHVHAMAEAEEMHREALATIIPRIPAHIRKKTLLEYIFDRRREHVRLSYEELDYHGDSVHINASKSTVKKSGTRSGGVKSGGRKTENEEEEEGEEGLFNKSNVLAHLQSDDVGAHPLIQTLSGKVVRTEIRPFLLFTGNKYKHTYYRRNAEKDMFGLIEKGVVKANAWAKEHKSKGTKGMGLSTRLKDSEVKEVMRRSSVVGTSSVHMRHDYLKALLEENMGEFR